jgi:hypothetical protein
LRYFLESQPFPNPFGIDADNEGRLPDDFNEKVVKGILAADVKGFIHTRVGNGQRKLALMRHYLDQMA